MAIMGLKTRDSVVTGSTGISTVVQLQNADGTPATGFTHATSGLVAAYARVGETVATITLVTQTVTGGWTSGGFVEIDATNQPGAYRLDLPNAAFAAGASAVGLSVTKSAVESYAAAVWLVSDSKIFATVASSPTRFGFTLTGPTVGTNQLLRRQVQMLDGAAAHERCTIIDCQSSGAIVLSPPLTVAPTAGDRVLVL